MSELRVLVVEDEPQVAAGHASYVSRVSGFTMVDTVGTLRDALRILSRQRVDLVLLDLNLPDGNGLHLVRSIRGAGQPVDILAITAIREVATVRAALSLGVVGYLMKPFTYADFAERLIAYGRYREGLATAGSTSQHQVDDLLRDLHHPRTEASGVPKGLSRELLDRVIEELRSGGVALSASEVAERVATSRVTARRYLQYLVAAGVVGRSQRIIGSGRPEVTFAWRAL